MVASNGSHFQARGAAAELFRTDAQEILLEGPAGCVAGETELWDPIAGVGRRIDDLAASGVRPWVQTMSGPVLAHAPFVKGYAPLYRVTLRSGQSCLATADHLFMTPAGWTFVSDLAPGMELRSALPANVRHLKQTGAGSRCGCRPYLRSHGQQPRQELAVGQGERTSGSDVRGSVHVGSLRDGSASRSASNRTCLAFALHAICGSDAQRWLAPSDWSMSSVDHATVGVEFHAESGTSERDAFQFQSPGQSRRESLRTRPSSPRTHDCENRPTSGRASLGCPCLRYGTQWDPIKSIVYERTDFYYDLHVPGPEHYFADGIVSHNTGKTRACLELIDYRCRTYPGIRVLMVRQTRKSMSESVLVTYEEHVLGPNHPAIVGDASRENRVAYTYPNGSHVVLGGMDNPDRIMSTEYDLIVFFEATEGTVDGWEKLMTRCRNNKMPLQQAIADCNPAGSGHWLNKRAERGLMKRLLSRHGDNPRYDDPAGAKYLDRLKRLSGARRKRLYEGMWATEEGLIFDSYNPSIHIVDRIPVGTKVRWRLGAVDWGLTAPGVFQVWAVTENETVFREVEVYRTGKTLDWWANLAVNLTQKYDLMTIVADPEGAGNIAKFNDMLGSRRICRKADNDFMPSINLLEQRFAENRIFLLRGALQEGVDMDLFDKDKPTCLERELEEYVWFKNEEGKPIREQPDKSCEDHAVDAMRYMSMFVWRRDLSKPEEKKTYAYGTAGYILDHDAVMNPRRPARTIEEILHG